MFGKLMAIDLPILVDTSSAALRGCRLSEGIIIILSIARDFLS